MRNTRHRRSHGARTEGLFVPLDDVPAYLANGWRLSEDARLLPDADGRLLLLPPPERSAA